MVKAKNTDKEPRRVVIVTGMSGAGRTVGLRALEDIGFEAIDNIPLKLVDTLVDEDAKEQLQPLVIGIDSRSRAFSPDDFAAKIDELKANPKIDFSLMFFDCDETILVNRYSENRRVHHLAPDRPIRDGISIERKILKPIRRRADSMLDTSNLSAAVAKRRVQSKFRMAAGSQMVITVMSYGFKRGVPRDVDLVFDVRFLRNPHYEEDLRPLTGKHEEVATYVMADENFLNFKRKINELIDFLIPLYEQEGKHYLTIGFGCTGGKHRSVMCAEWLGKRLQKLDHQVNIIHRDLPRKERE